MDLSEEVKDVAEPAVQAMQGLDESETPPVLVLKSKDGKIFEVDPFFLRMHFEFMRLEFKGLFLCVGRTPSSSNLQPYQDRGGIGGRCQ